MAEPQHNHITQFQTSKTNFPSTSNVVALAAILPFGITLLILAGLTLTATVVCLTVVAPLLLIFGPVLIPAALVIGLAVTGFLTSAAFGITSLSSLAWLATYFRRRSRSPELHALDTGDDLPQNKEEASPRLVSQPEGMAQKDAAPEDHEAQKHTEPKAQEAQKDRDRKGQQRKECIIMSSFIGLLWPRRTGVVT